MGLARESSLFPTDERACTKDGLQTAHFTDHVQTCFLFLTCRKTSLQMMKAIANATDRKQTSYREGISPFSSIS